MPIHDVAYRRFEGARAPRSARVWALARSELALLVRQRRFLLLLAAAWVPAVVRAVQIYVAQRLPQAGGFLEVSPGLWRDFLTQQVSFLLVLLVALYAGAGSIASDRRSGALLIYLSKPLSRLDYLAAKTVPLLASLLAITAVPAVALLLFYLSLSENWTLLASTPWLIGSVIGYSLWLSLYFSLLVLGVSSLCTSRRLAATGFALLSLGTHAVYGAALRISVGKAPPFLSILETSTDAAHVFFGSWGEHTSPLLSVLVMAGVVAACLLLINRQLRASEVAS